MSSVASPDQPAAAPGPDWPFAFGLPLSCGFPSGRPARSSAAGSVGMKVSWNDWRSSAAVGLPYESTSTIVWPSPCSGELVDAVRLADVARHVAVEVAAGRVAARPARVVRAPARLDLHRPARRLEGRRAEANRGRRSGRSGGCRDDREHHRDRGRHCCKGLTHFSPFSRPRVRGELGEWETVSLCVVLTRRVPDRRRVGGRVPAWRR